MIRHCILVKWNETVTDRASLLPAIEAIFRKTLTIPGVERVELLPNVVDRPNRYDLMIAVTMDAASLPAYDASDAHREWKETYSSRITSKAIFDHNA